MPNFLAIRLHVAEIWGITVFNIAWSATLPFWIFKNLKFLQPCFATQHLSLFFADVGQYHQISNVECDDVTSCCVDVADNECY